MLPINKKRQSPLRFLIWGYIVWSLVPVVIAVIFSFNDGRSRTVWQGFSLRWWWQDPNLSVFQSAEMRNAIVNSLVLAVSTLLIVTPLGIALAIGSQRIRGRNAKFVQSLTSTPLITPEIVVGAALLLTFRLVPLSKKQQETSAPPDCKHCASCSYRCFGRRSWPVSWSYSQQ